MKALKRLCVLVCFVFALCGIEAAESSGPVHPLSFQAGMSTFIRDGSNVMVFGPYAAFTPLLDFGAAGLRGEVSWSQMKEISGSTVSTWGWGAYLRFPVSLKWGKGDRTSSFHMTVDALQFEFGGGMEKWSTQANWRNQISMNVALLFHWYIERFTVGYMYVFDNTGANIVMRVGLGFSIF